MSGSGRVSAYLAVTGSTPCDLSSPGFSDSDSFSQGTTSILGLSFDRYLLAATGTTYNPIGPVAGQFELESAAETTRGSIDTFTRQVMTAVEFGHLGLGYSDYPLYAWTRSSASSCVTYNYYFTPPAVGTHEVEIEHNTFDAVATSSRTHTTRHYPTDCHVIPVGNNPVIGFRHFERVRLTSYTSSGSTTVVKQGAWSLTAGAVMNVQGAFIRTGQPVCPQQTNLFCSAGYGSLPAGYTKSCTKLGGDPFTQFSFFNTTRLEVQKCSNMLIGAGLEQPAPSGVYAFIPVGDANLNGIVRLADRNLVASLAATNISINSDPNGTYNVAADLDEDGTIDSDDLDLFDLIYCPADYTKDGVVNSSDYFAFINLFFNLDPKADYNEDGVVNSQDNFDFMNYQNPCQ